MKRNEITATAGIVLTLLTGCGGSAHSIAEQSEPAVTEMQITDTTTSETQTETAAVSTAAETADIRTAPPATAAEPEIPAKPAETAAPITKAPETVPPPATDPPAPQKTYADYFAALVQRGSLELEVGRAAVSVQCVPYRYLLADLNADGVKEIVISYDPSNDPTYFYLMEIQQCAAIENGTVSEKKPSSMQFVIEQYFAADGNGLIDVLYRANGGGYSFGRDLPLTWEYQELGQQSYDEDYDRMKRDAMPYCGAELVWYPSSDLSALAENVPE